MPRRRTSEPFGYEPYPALARIQMKDLISALNSTRIGTDQISGSEDSGTIRLRLSRSQRELRRLIKAWLESGPNLKKLFAQEPYLEQRTKYGRTIFYATSTGRGHLDWIPSPGESNQSSPENQALDDFKTLIANPQWESLGGPCSHCKDYFLKHTKRKHVFCSRACSSRATAIPAIRKRRQREHREKILRAQKCIEEWSKVKRRRSSEWKKWVSIEAGYSVRWITRAVNNGTLKPPKTAVGE